MNVAASFNKKYVNYAIVMLTSFCESNPGHNDIFIMHSELEKEDIDKLSAALQKYGADIFPIDVSKEISNLNLPVSEDWSPEIYYRLLLPDKLPGHVDRIFYLDVDVIVHGSLQDLYEEDFEGADLRACHDSNNTSTLDDFSDKTKEMLLPLYGEEFPYFNSGVLLINIAQMRGKYTFQTYLDAMEKWDYKMDAPDQDILNYIHYDKVKYMNWEEYDLFARMAYSAGWRYEEVKEKNKIIHFAGAKPWNFDNTHYEIERFWWEYAALTPVYRDLMENFIEYALTNTYLEDEAIRLCNENKEFAKAITDLNDALSKLQASTKGN